MKNTIKSEIVTIMKRVKERQAEKQELIHWAKNYNEKPFNSKEFTENFGKNPYKLAQKTKVNLHQHEECLKPNFERDTIYFIVRQLVRQLDYEEKNPTGLIDGFVALRIIKESVEETQRLKEDKFYESNAETIRLTYRGMK